METGLRITSGALITVWLRQSTTPNVIPIESQSVLKERFVCHST